MGDGLKQPPKVVVLAGKPGSGKGTQARLLQKRLGFAHVSTGDMLRNRAAFDDPLGRELGFTLQSGGLASDEIVSSLVMQRLEEPDCQSGFILDGYPRTIEQARLLAELLKDLCVRPIVIHLQVSSDVVMSRLAGRMQCSACGEVYSLNSNPPRIPGVCDSEGAALVVRGEDRADVAKERLQIHEGLIGSLLGFFKSSGYRVCELSGNDPPHDVTHQIELLIR